MIQWPDAFNLSGVRTFVWSMPHKQYREVRCLNVGVGDDLVREVVKFSKD
jgi:hypothetical protein